MLTPVIAMNHKGQLTSTMWHWSGIPLKLTCTGKGLKNGSQTIDVEKFAADSFVVNVGAEIANLMLDCDRICTNADLSAIPIHQAHGGFLSWALVWA